MRSMKMELPRKCSWLGVQYVFGIGVTWGNHFHIFPHIAMKSLAMALCTLLGLVMALVIMVSWHSESLWQEPSWGRNLRATDIIEIFPKFDVHSLNKVIPGKCLRQQLEKELKWMWWVACDSLEKHWVALLSCFALAAALCAVRQWDSWDGGYRLVQQVVDEDQIGDMKGLHGKTAIIYTGCLWLLDMASDVYVIQAYYTQGMYVFAFLLIWIWVGSGLLAFVHRYLSWERCDYKTNIEFWAQGLNSDGQARPGVAVLALYLLQLEPFVVAYRSWNHGMTLQLREEKTLTAVCEGAPSALLQIYALLVIGPQGSPMILSGSIALSILTVAEGVNMGYELCLPEGKHAESHLPRVLLAGFRWCDVYWRISIWALLGMALRPIHGKRQGIQQPYLPFIMAFEFLLVCVVFKMGLQLRKWSDIFQKRYFVGCICCFLSTFVCSYDKGLVPQQRLSRTLVALRSVESLVTLCLCALIFSATLEGVCILTEEPALLTIALVTVFTSSLAMVFAAANDIALSCWALPLFPVISGLKGGRLELAARLGLASQIRQGSENVEYYVAALCQAAEAGHVSAVEACRCELDVPITSTLSTGETAMHFAAKGGQVQVMETLQAAGSQDLEIVDSEGQTPAWTAAASGHLDVLKFLQTSGCNLETANDDGRTPAFMAARNCHLEVLKFLRSSGCNLATANNEGRTPAWSAAANGHLEILKFLQISGCNLDTANNEDWTPAFVAAANGHLEVLKFLQSSGCNLEAANNNGSTLAWSAARNGHLHVLRFLHSSSYNLETPNSNGSTPAWCAARNGHLEVLIFLQSSGCNLETAVQDGWTPALVAARYGHLEVLKFLQISGCNLETPNNDGETPAFVAARNGHLEVLKFLQSSGCNLEAANNNGSTPAWSAARWDHLDVLKFLQSSGYNLETPTSDGSTPTWCAARNGHLEVLKFLQSSGCNLETPNNDRETPALVAARYGHLEVLRFLQSSACNLEIADQDGDTPAWAAAQQGHLEVLKFLQSSGCSIHVSCLHTAVKRNRLELVEFLLSAVDVNAPGICGLRALDIARANDASSSVTEALVKAGATSAPTPQLVGLTALKPLEPPAHAYVWLTCGLPELAQSTGKFYHEIHLLSEFENPQLGWLSTDFIGGEKDGKGVGDDSHSWGFDGGRCGWWHDQKMEPLGISKWRVNDVLGFALDLDQGTMQLHTQQGEQITVPFQFQGTQP